MYVINEQFKEHLYMVTWWEKSMANCLVSSTNLQYETWQTKHCGRTNMMITRNHIQPSVSLCKYMPMFSKMSVSDQINHVLYEVLPAETNV